MPGGPPALPTEPRRPGAAATTTRPPRAGAPVSHWAGSPWAFAGIYLGWAYLWWAPLLGSDSSVWQGRNLLLFLLGGASPLLAAVLLARRHAGRSAVTDLARRLVDVRRIGLRWWLVAVTFWLGVDLALGAAAVGLGITERPFTGDWGLLVDPAALAFPLVLAFVLPAVEEVGLRGWYLERLLERLPVPAATLVNGVTWAAWHAPFVLLPGYYDDVAFDPALAWWLPMIVCDAVLISWIYLRTRRSILAALVFHGMMNLTGLLLGISADMYPFALAGHALPAIAVLARWSRGPRVDQPPAYDVGQR